MIENKNILITGGCGFIGSQLVDKLKLCNKITVVDRVPKNLHPNVNYEIKDLTNYFEIKNLFKGIDVVFHFASDISIKDCVENPGKSLYNNTLINNNVLESSRVNKVEKLVFSSTAAVYKQKQEKVKCTENCEVEPLNPYSVSKLYGEQLCKIYYNLYGLKTVVLRYFNVFGNTNITSSYASVLNNFLYAFKNNLPLNINGSGDQTRDFVGVQDVVNANISSAKVELPKYGETFNIGSGKTISILELAKLISNEINFNPIAKGELMHSVADITKAKTLLNWQPKESVCNWITSQLN